MNTQIVERLIRENPMDVDFLLKKYRTMEPPTVQGVINAGKKAGMPFIQDFALLAYSGAVISNPEGELMSPVRASLDPSIQPTTTPDYQMTRGDWLQYLPDIISQVGDTVTSFLKPKQDPTAIQTPQPANAGIFSNNMVMIGLVAVVVILIVVVILKK